MDLPSVDEISSEENLLVMGTGNSSADEVLRQVQDCDAETFTSTVSVDKNQLGRAMRNITIGPYPRDSQDQSLSKYHHPAFIQEARRAGLLSDPEANFCFCSALVRTRAPLLIYEITQPLLTQLSGYLDTYAMDRLHGQGPRCPPNEREVTGSHLQSTHRPLLSIRRNAYYG